MTILYNTQAESVFSVPLFCPRLFTFTELERRNVFVCAFLFLSLSLPYKYNLIHCVRHLLHKYLICCCCYWYCRYNNSLFQFVDLMYRSNCFRLNEKFCAFIVSPWTLSVSERTHALLWELLSVDINDDALGASTTREKKTNNFTIYI